MCISSSNVSFAPGVNWDGDYIIKNCKVPSSHVAIGTKIKYETDVREFLVTEKNAVMQETLRIKVQEFMKTDEQREYFNSRTEGSFDFRVFTIMSFIKKTIKYKTSKGRDYWRFPDETLAVGSGDCEDVAFLIASLMSGAGISPYNVRVAIGHIIEQKNNREVAQYDHAWVVYKSESGRWKLIEPLLHVDSGKKRVKSRTGVSRKSNASYIYDPSFIFNTDHLWSCEHARENGTFRQATFIKEWNRINPRFAGTIHKKILYDALAQADQKFKNHIIHQFVLLNSVDVMDLPWRYKAEDHFDNAQIDEGWSRVKERLKNFIDDPQKNFEAFFQAAHGIADFYAHSSYATFARPDGPDNIQIYWDEDFKPVAHNNPDYRAGGNFDFTHSQPNSKWQGDYPSRIAHWQGKIISGRYAQRGDHKDTFEGLSTTVPSSMDTSNFWALPHHNEIAVDDDKNSHGNIIYRGTDFRTQYTRRYNAAVKHITMVYEKCLEKIKTI